MRKRESSVTRRPPPCVVLVRVAAEEEPSELQLTKPPVHAIRLLEPVPAALRIQILRPHLVLAGASLPMWALADLICAARDAGADLIELGKLTMPDGWFTVALADVVARRAREESGEHATVAKSKAG
jgi:hypothetical protein